MNISNRPSLSLLAPFSLLLAMVLTGCQPDHTKDIKVYRDILSVRGDDKRADSNQPLSLHQALLLANGQNERLAIAGENYLQALIDKKRAVANFLPTVGLGADYTRIDGSNLPAGASDHQFDTFASANMNIFSGFSDVADLKRKNAVIGQQKQLLLEAQESLLIDVASVYYQVLRSEQSTEVLQNSLKLQQERVRDMQARSKAGIARPLDVYQTQATASATRVQWLNARNQVATGRALLAFLLNAPVEGSPLSDNYSVPAETPLLQSLHDSAGKNRKDLMAAQAASDAARQRIEVVFGQYYPSVSLNFTAMLSQHPVEGPDWSGILNVNLPIFSAGRIEADVQQAWSQFRQAELTVQQLARKVRQEVEASYRDFADSIQRLIELQTQVNAAEQAFTQADQSYNVGFATNLERLTAQDQMLAAQLQLASERYNNKVFYLALLRATGTMRTQALSQSAAPHSDQP